MCEQPTLHARFTTLFERRAVDAPKESDLEGAARILRISGDGALHTLERAVARGLMAEGERVCSRIGADEKSAGKGHRSITVVWDLSGSAAEYIGDDRREESLDTYLRGLSEERPHIHAALPRRDTFFQHIATLTQYPCFDRRRHLMLFMFTGLELQDPYK